jgi:hypothetical protein
VVAFGVAAMAAVLGLILIVIGLALRPAASTGGEASVPASSRAAA